MNKVPQCCGEEKYKDCHGNYRCMCCEGSCPCCDDGAMGAQMKWFEKPETQLWIEKTMRKDKRA